ncbi:GTP 3',8-cyclase MoaA [Thioalkalivibrio sp. HK1]|uniref:GTP 3',8-cyclase MoaA n=1 Tax=Thioalkalivibrio sp. HK1 TaxID=1469245 RepID=UPI0027D25A7C|nr:GTP 3',8-cyclase MoaA [Thioalkalivibrio sp. HK1]
MSSENNPSSSSASRSSKRPFDLLGRSLHDLRISVTDRCNFRCTYCMPKSVFGAGHRFMPRKELLTFEEIRRLVSIFVSHGVRKIRLTGGEPLLRQNLDALVRMLGEIDGVDDLTLTTNASLLSAQRAEELHAAGLRRLTVSLDALDDGIFSSMNDMGVSVRPVLEAIDHAERAGFASIKINMVVQRKVNDSDILPMARRFKGTPHIVRFIEYMDVGSTNGWRLDDVVPAEEIIRIIDREHPLEPLEPNYAGEVARRWRYVDGDGEIGVITSVTRPFCGACSRARLSAEGRLYTCLFATRGFDLRSLLRGGIDDEALANAIASRWRQRDDRYSELRSEMTLSEGATTEERPRIEMSYIGG